MLTHEVSTRGGDHEFMRLIQEGCLDLWLEDPSCMERLAPIHLFPSRPDCDRSGIFAIDDPCPGSWTRRLLRLTAFLRRRKETTQESLKLMEVHRGSLGRSCKSPFKHLLKVISIDPRQLSLHGSSYSSTTKHMVATSHMKHPV